MDIRLLASGFRLRLPASGFRLPASGFRFRLPVLASSFRFRLPVPASGNSPFWHFFGTNSKPEKGEFLKPQNRSSGMAVGVGNSSPGWKISIEDDGFIKIWLTWF